MNTFKPKYITFDCYGTLIFFEMGPIAQTLFADRISVQDMPRFIKNFSAYRMDEVLGDWKPYNEVIRNAVKRLCELWKIEYRDQDSIAIYNAVPTWGPHPDVVEPLKKIAGEIPLVILSNAMNEQIGHNVKSLEAPFHAVYTAQQANAYKPRLQAFEYMLDNLGCNPEDILHVSSSLRYDLMSAYDIGIKNKVFVNRGHEPGTPYYEYREIKDIGGLPGLVGL